jgi:zinc-ribbon domain
MYCSGCGQGLQPGQTFCPQCGRPVTVAPPPVPGLQFELVNYAAKIRALSTVWFIYAGLNLVLSFAGMAFARFFMRNGMAPWGHGPWMNGPIRPEWFGPIVLQFIWLFVVLWSVFLFAVGWGLIRREPWGRIVAIVAAFLNLFKFPFGTALGIWTLIVLMGYRNQTLYEQLP